MNAIIHLWKTITDTFRVLGQYSYAWLYPLLSYLIMLLLTFSLMIPLLDMLVELGHEAGPMRLFFFLAVYFMYGILYFVTTFFTVALLSRLAGQLEGEKLPFNRGISVAFQRIGPIAHYTLLSATLSWVAIAAKVLTNPFLGGVIIPLIGKRLWLRWRHLSYNLPLLLAVPVIALDQPVPEHIFQRSGLLVKEIWGEGVKPAHSISLLGLLVLLMVILFALPTLQQGSTEHNSSLIRLGSSVLLVSILTYTQLNALVNAIFALAAYRYATVRKSDLFPGDASYAEQAFVKPKKETDEAAAPTVPISGSSSAIAGDPLN